MTTTSNVSTNVSITETPEDLALKAKHAALIQRVEDTKELSKDDESELAAAIQEFKKHGAF